MLNKKGFTVVELIVSFALTMLVSVMLFQMLISLKDMYVGSGLKGQLLSKQALISSKINGDFENKTIKLALKCGSNCLNFFFEDNTSKKLIVDIKNNLITYGEYTTKLVEGSSFDDININNETVFSVSDGMSDSIIEIDIPIYHKTLKENYGINIIYQYDSRTSAISNIIFDNDPTTQDGIILIGSQEMLQKSGEAYSEPGHYTFESDGDIILNNPNVTVTGLIGSTPGQTYTLTYTLRNASNQIVDAATREITIVKSTYDFNYSGGSETFTAPFDGTYKIELWGAQGGVGPTYASSSSQGAYTTGTIYLAKGETIYLYVGKAGELGSYGINATSTVGQGGPASFNGGGVGGNAGGGSYPYANYIGGASGGGATDVRLVNGAWNNVTSLRSRLMVAGGGGGAAGSLNLGIFDTENGTGGALTSNKGGVDGFIITREVAYAADILKRGSGATQVAGAAFGVGSAGANTGIAGYCSGHSGGGGGYYGGNGAQSTGGNCFSMGGAGGTSYISGHIGVNSINSSGTHTGLTSHYSGYVFYNTNMIDGKSSMPNKTGSGNIVGNRGDGFARITLIGFVNETVESISSVDYLVVAGGGAGGFYVAGGGGGGGGVVSGTSAVTVGNYPIVVGAGGLGTNGAGNRGENSSFNGFTAIGGGGGGAGWTLTKGTTGGSGGGTSGGDGASGAVSLAGELGTPGQGYAGGTGWRCSSNSGVGGGGGGAGAVGTSGVCTTRAPGNGGAGISSSISGTLTWYGGGGGADSYNPNIAGTGGTGGGGNAGVKGVNNTGGGGGAGYGLSNNGFSGGSGVVIIRYPGVQKASGGIVTYVGGYTIHTFTSSSTFVVW